MSVVTNTILACGLADSHEPNPPYSRDGATLLKHVNELPTLAGATGFVAVDGWHYGGTKALECFLAIAAFNYLDLDRLVADLRTLPWEQPECVQLLVREQEAIGFRIINVFPEAIDGLW